MAITVTATSSGTGSANGLALAVKVLTGAAASQTGATANSFLVTQPELGITPSATGSYVYGAVGNGAASTAFSGTTAATQAFEVNFSDTTNNVAYGLFRSATTTTSGTPITLGATAPSETAGFIDIALAEILASGTLAEDASSPAVPTPTKTAKTLTTASFTPAANSILVATVSTNGTGAANSVAVTDSASSYNWTQQSVSSVAYASVWIGVLKTSGVTGAVSPLALAAPAGTVKAGATVVGTVSSLALAAPAGTAGIGLPGTVSSLTLAAPAGSVKAGASISGAVAPLALAAAAGNPHTLTPFLVQQVIGGDEFDYGFSSTDMVTTAGNGLVMFAGWDLHNAPTTAPVPALYPADSAGNYWYHLGTSPVGGYGSRCTIWACPNARSIEWVSACMTAYANSMVFTVCEIENFPQFCDVDVSASSFVNSGIPSEQVFSTPGPFTWQAPPGVTAVGAQGWGGGGPGGSTGPAFEQGGAGGSGEYASEPSAAVTPGNVYSGNVGAGGAPGTGTGTNGGATTFTADSVTVTAHGGHAGIGGAVNGAGGAKGTGSTNTIHYDGAAGGAGSNVSTGNGGGGAGAAGSGGPGNAGGSPSAGAGGAGAFPGGNGGAGNPLGGTGNQAAAGLAPGGGGGGSSSQTNAHPGAPGARGQVILTYSVSSPTSLTVSGTTTSADIGFSLIAAGAGDMLLTSAPSGWSNLGSGVTIGGASPDGMTIFPYWKSSITSGTNLSTSYTVSPEIAISSVLATIQASPAAPVQPNPNFPVLKVEIAEGFTPGDPSAAPPAWTDITARCIGKDGGSFITTGYGQQYELATPEAGEMVIGVLNNDGAFTPGNVASPYYPYIVLGMPVRVSAYWDGSWYQVGYGYVERWPQEWPDLPQWGLSMLTCTDSIAVLTSTTMPSALQGDILADAPYFYFPLGEQYLNTVNGLTSSSGPLYSYTSAESAGLIAANASRVNQKAAMYCDGTGTQAEALETGDALNLLGDQGTGVGTSAISGSIVYNTNVTGPGVIYNDPDMPDPTNAAGVSVEFWFVYNEAETSGQGLTLFQAFTGPSAYWPTNNTAFSTAGPASFGVVLDSSSNTLIVTLNSSTGTTVGSFTPSANPQQIVVTFPPSGSDALNVYLNGALLGTVSLTGGQTTAWIAAAMGPCAYAYTSNPLVQNYVAGHWASFPYVLSAGRIAAHYATGSQGAGGVTVSQGAAQILSWGYLGLPHGGPSQFNGASDGIEMGPFYSLAGSSASDGLNGLILSDGGMMYAAPSGVLTILPRWALFNQAPSVTFGDSVTAGQVPFLEGQAFDYDNTYLYNVVQVTRDDGTLTSITAQVKNSPSQLAYFTRSALQQSISTTSDLDAYTLANWESGVYAQPAVRVRTLTVDAASNPTVAFPAILPTVVSNVAGVQRTPVGGVPIIGTYLVQKVGHTIGPTSWHVDYQLSPYVQPSTVLALDTSSYNVLGNNTLA